MIAVEITGADPTGALRKYYFSDNGFSTSPSDTPANISFVDRLVECGRLGINAYSDGRTGGGTKLEIGQTVIANNDGEYDELLNYSFDGREIVIRKSQDDRAPYPGGFQVVMRGTMRSLQADFDKLTFELRDKLFMFDKQLLTTTYAGTNLLPLGVEGTTQDVKGKIKPIVFGRVFNIEPPQVNTSKLTYQVSTNAVTINAVYDRGVVITPGADYATVALLEAASPAPSTFITCKALGFFRLGTIPVGTVTADVTQGATVADRTVAQLMRQVALQGGLAASDINSSDVAALDASNSAEAGIYINDNAKTTDVLDKLAQSVTGWYSFDQTGQLRMGRLTAPTGTPVATIVEDDMYKNGMQRRTPKDQGLPVWKVKLKYGVNYTKQTTDLAGSVGTVRRAYLSLEERTAEASDPAIKDLWLLSEPLEVETVLINEADAQAEAARLLALHKVRREIYDIPVDIDAYMQYSVKLMDLVRIVHPRFGMSQGRLFRLIGYRIELGKNRVILVVWG